MKAINVFDGKIGYRDLPKTACTSIKAKMYHLLTGQKYQSVMDEHSLHKFFEKPEYHKSIDGCEFKFVIVRDPIKRFLSAYSNRVLDHKNLSVEFLSKKPANKHLIPELPKLNPSLSEFIDNLVIYTNVPMIYHHVCPIARFMQNKKLDYFDKVYKFEDIGRLEKDLSKILRKDFSLEREQTSSKKYKLHDLTYGQLKYLIRYYREDYKLLKEYYNPDDVWSEWYRGAGLKSKAEFKARKSAHKLRRIVRELTSRMVKRLAL